MEQESECLKKMKNGDLEARNELIERNMRLVAHVAKKYQSPEDEMEDLISVAAEQNFVPVIDDKNDFIGIVTRSRILHYCQEAYFAKTAQKIS